jgi:surface antigen
MKLHKQHSHRGAVLGFVALALGASLTLPAGPAAADPPPWAPAHGQRHKKQKGTTQVVYVAPPGIAAGTCDRAALDPAIAGAIVGGVAGAAIGSQIGGGSGKTAATIAGTLIGMAVGSSIGSSMAPADHGCAAQSLEHASERQTIAWRNPDTGAAYEVTPQRTFQNREGRYCREYLTKANVGGQTQQVYGTACRQPDGSWQIVE